MPAEEAHHYEIEWALMALSVLLAVGAIWFARRNYVERPEEAERLAKRLAGTHRLLTNKYYVDELYDATFVRGSMSSARGLWRFDGGVVDGAVNGTGWTTRASATISHVLDKYVVDGLVNPGRLDMPRGKLRLPPRADRPHSELCVRHFGWRVRVRDLVPRRALTPPHQDHEQRRRISPAVTDSVHSRWWVCSSCCSSTVRTRT